MGNENKAVCATIKCPPLREASSDFVGKTIKEARNLKLSDGTTLKDKLEIADGASVTVSTDGGETYKAANDNHIIGDKEVVEFGRGSSTKGC
jgi:hypothetical protein